MRQHKGNYVVNRSISEWSIRPLTILMPRFHSTIPFPFQEKAVPTLSLQYQWTAQQLLSYLNTWSALKHYQEQHADDPLQLISNALKAAPEYLYVTFPVLLRVGTVKK